MTEIIAEIGNIHEGSLGIAMCLTDIAANAGVDIIKFQMHEPQFESSKYEEFRVNFSKQDDSRQAYWNRTSFSSKDWIALKDHCDSRGVEFLCTPFSIQAAKFLHENQLVRRWKVGSGDTSNFPLLDYLSGTQLPLIISTGLVSELEIHALRERLQRLGSWERTTLMHCVSEYPTPLERSSLRLIDELRKLGCEVGLSDHSGKLSSALVALTKKISLLEIHLTPHKHFFGPDISSSLTGEEIEVLTSFALDFSVLENSNFSRDELLEFAGKSQVHFRKSIYWAHDLEIGSTVKFEDFMFLKPRIGVDAMFFENFLGRTIVSAVKSGEPIKPADFEPLG